MTKRVHMCQSVTGPLMNWKKRDWQKATSWMTRNDGSLYTADELKQVFVNLLAEGKEVIPIGDCDNFDFKKGCNGHPLQPGEPDPFAKEANGEPPEGGTPNQEGTR